MLKLHISIGLSIDMHLDYCPLCMGVSVFIFFFFSLLILLTFMISDQREVWQGV